MFVLRKWKWYTISVKFGLIKGKGLNLGAETFSTKLYRTPSGFTWEKMFSEQDEKNVFFILSQEKEYYGLP